MERLLAVLVMACLAVFGAITLRYPTAVQRTLRMPDHQTLRTTPERMRDLIRFSGAVGLMSGVGGIVASLLA